MHVGIFRNAFPPVTRKCAYQEYSEKNPAYIVPHIIKNLVIQYVNEAELLPDLLN